MAAPCLFTFRCRRANLSISRRRRALPLRHAVTYDAPGDPVARMHASSFITELARYVRATGARVRDRANYAQRARARVNYTTRYSDDLRLLI